MVQVVRAVKAVRAVRAPVLGGKGWQSDQGGITIKWWSASGWSGWRIYAFRKHGVHVV